MGNLLDDFVPDFQNGPLSDFGTAVAFTHGSLDPVSIQGIFDNNFVVLKDGIETTSPALTCNLADVSNAVSGDKFTIYTQPYFITELQPDGNGMITFLLSTEVPQQ